MSNDTVPTPDNGLRGDLGNGTYMNPILAGDYADPAIVRVGEDYYMTHSSFTFAPGLLIWHSRDLVNWQPVCKAMDRYIGDVWAPDFIVHDGLFYIYVPIDGKIFAFTAEKPAGPWSDPIDLGLTGIDPGHIADQEGNRYLHIGAGYMAKLAADGLSVAEAPRRVYDGWEFPEEWVVEGKFLESPKLLYRKGYYYLTSAQGGTSGPPTSHMVVSARSKFPWGPFENSPYNPIVRTSSKEERWCSRGHGTLIDTPDGDWWIVYHAYEKDYYTLGRQTLLEPIEWTADGWFRVPDSVSVDRLIPMPKSTRLPHGLPRSDDFRAKELGLQWSFYKQHDPGRYALTGDALVMRGAAGVNPLVYMPEDHSYEVSVEVAIGESSEGKLLLFYNDRSYSGMGLSKQGVYGILRGWNCPPIPYEHATVHMRLRSVRHEVIFYYSTDGANWTKLPHSYEASGFHHNALGGFLALRIGLDASGDGEVEFRNWTYKRI